jgi:hypothetical protein
MFVAFRPFVFHIRNSLKRGLRDRDWVCDATASLLRVRRSTGAREHNRCAAMPSARHPPPRLQSYAETRSRCGVCGGTVTTGSRYCLSCVPIVNRENLLAQAKLGRIATHSPTAEARRSATQIKQFAAIRSWNPSELPRWLNEKAYRREILPRLSKFTVKAIRLALGVSHPYATNIRRGVCIPHSRHWAKLANLAGIAHD